MMRIPIHNICRAFPELDRFTDDQCQHFLEATLKQHRIARLGMRALMVVCFCVGWFGLTYLVMLFAQMFGVRGPLVTWQVPLALISIILGALFGGVVGLMLRDRWLRARLSARLLQLACPACTYSLLGLPAVDGTIICPECGTPHHLTAQHIEVDTTLLSS